MKILIVYYSRTGTTKKLALDLATELKADKEEIIDLKNRKGVRGFLVAGKDAIREKPTKILEPKNDIKKYDLVIIGSPLWAGRVSPAVRTFLKINKDKFGNVACFVTSGGNSPGKSFNDIEKSIGKSVIAKLHLRSKEVHQNFHKDKIMNFKEELDKLIPLKKVISKNSNKKSKRKK